MAKLKADLFGVPDGEVYPRLFAAGEICPPDLEAAAAAMGVLDANDAAATAAKADGKAMRAAENKAMRAESHK
jgi:hypothetical protein